MFSLVSGCKKKGAVGLPPCGDGRCSGTEPFVCPQDCGGIQISGGGEHTCTVKMSDGTVWCWGLNDYGQLGTGELASTPVPNRIAVGMAVDAVFAGDDHTCALVEDDRSVRCWGKNDSGQLGDGTSTDSATPVEVAGLEDVRVLTVGGGHTCGLDAAGSVWCWGWNAFGQIGREPSQGEMSSTTPVLVEGPSDVVRLSAGRVHTCALTRWGEVYCWGWNEYGQLGVHTTGAYSAHPTMVAYIGSVVSLSAGGHHTCAVADDGRVWCWGENEYGQVGSHVGDYVGHPVELDDPHDAVSVSAGRIHTCAVQRQGKVWCWGANSSGQLGAGSLADSSTFPLEVQTITDVTYISAGGYHTCAVESSGMLWCWGYNRTGQLGDTTYTNRFTPAKVIGLGLEAGTSD